MKNKGFANNSSNLERFSSLQRSFISLIETLQQEYFSKITQKLSVPNTRSTTYCSVLKSILTDKRGPCIHPILHVNKVMTNFREKAELFNSYFANQCILITNTSELPTNCESLTDKSLSNISFTDNDLNHVGKIIKGLDSNKTHDHDMMSIGILKICGFLRSGDIHSMLEKSQRYTYS